MIKKDGKKGLSPVIATVLLVSIALILALIIFLWAKSVVSEKIEKFNEPIENSCEKVKFRAELIRGSDKGEVHIENIGNVALYGVEIRGKSSGTISSLSFTKANSCGSTITVGETCDVGDFDLGEFKVDDKVIVVPVILGETNSNKKAFICDTNYGVETTVK